MHSTSIRARRIAAGIPGNLLCAKLGIQRSKLSDIEKGYVQPSRDEQQRIEQALDELTRAKNELLKVAAKLGWPMN